MCRPKRVRVATYCEADHEADQDQHGQRDAAVRVEDRDRHDGTTATTTTASRRRRERLVGEPGAHAASRRPEKVTPARRAIAAMAKIQPTASE